MLEFNTKLYNGDIPAARGNTSEDGHCKGEFLLAWPHMRRKYHMAKWDLLATPKKAGGAGFTNTRIRNKCFLAKWIFKIERGDQTLCCNLLRQKYLGERGIFSYKKHDGSQFWRGLMAVRGR
jgi:hypothetical protein